jgi:transposase
MASAYPLALRERIIEAREGGEGKQAIARRFLVGVSTVKRYLVQWEAEKQVAPRPHGGGPRRKVDEEGEGVLRRLVEEKPDFTDEELARAFSQETGVSISKATAQRAAKRLKLTFKKKPSRQRAGVRARPAPEVGLRPAAGAAARGEACLH